MTSTDIYNAYQQTYSLIIDRGISAPVHGKEVVDELNAVDKRYIYQLMSKVQLHESVRFDYLIHRLKYTLALKTNI